MSDICGLTCAPTIRPPKRKRRFSGCGFIEISTDVVKTWVHFARSKTAPNEQIIPSTCRVEIVRKGSDAAVATYNAFSVDSVGNVCFYWDDAFLAQPAGYYIGDVFLGGAYCFSLEFRIRACETIAAQCRNEYATRCQDVEPIGSDSLAICETSTIPLDMIYTAPPSVADCGNGECE